MIQIFKYFFSIIAIIILVYVLVVLGRTLLSAAVSFLDGVRNGVGTTTASTTTATTSTTTLVNGASILGLTLQNWVENFHPFQYAPMSVSQKTNPTYDGSGYGHTSVGSNIGYSYAQQLIDGFSDPNNDFDKRWGGGYYTDISQSGSVTDRPSAQNFPQNAVNNLLSQSGDSKYILPNTSMSAVIHSDQVITGMAYYQVFEGRVFPIYVLSENQEVIGLVKAFPNGSIKADGFVPFRAVLDFRVPTSEKGYLLFKNFGNNGDNLQAKTLVPVYFSEYSQLPVRQMPHMLFSTTDSLKNSCVITGCRMQLCVEQNTVKNVSSDCNLRPEYMCYQQATCERNKQTGKCGWRVDNRLASCLQQN